MAVTTTLHSLAILTPRDQRLLRALADVTLAPASLVEGALFDGRQPAGRKRVVTLAARGLVEVLHVDPSALPGGHRGARLLALAPGGAEAAAALGATPLTGAAQRAASVLAGAVVAVAEAYFAMLETVLESGGGTWTVRPDLPARGGHEAPDGAWALARSASWRESVIYDLDLPGRSYAQVAARLQEWSAYRGGGPTVTVNYVTPGDARRKCIADLAAGLEGVATGHPAAVTREVFGTPD